MPTTSEEAGGAAMLGPTVLVQVAVAGAGTTGAGCRSAPREAGASCGMSVVSRTAASAAVTDRLTIACCNGPIPRS